MHVFRLKHALDFNVNETFLSKKLGFKNC